MKIKEVINYLEQFAPSNYQEGYDNSGLIVGDQNNEVKGALICLDSIESVIDEAVSKGCNLVIAHHPIVFSGIKKLTGKNYIERTIIKAIKNDVAIYAIHTNLDNMLHGVNAKIAQKIGLNNLRILSPIKEDLRKLSVFVPSTHSEQVKNSLFEAGAGEIGNYSECSFSTIGEGSFKAGKNTNAFVGQVGERHIENEVKIEVIFPNYKKGNIIQAMISSHPYEEVAYDVYQLENSNQNVGAGMIGDLEEELDVLQFLNSLKKNMQTNCIRHTEIIKGKVKKIAFCGGSGSFLLGEAIAQKADVFITGDFKYHQFFDADKKVIIADIGHFESEQFTIDLLGDVLKEKFTTFAIHLTEINTNPINYL